MSTNPPLQKLANDRGENLAYRFFAGNSKLPAVIYCHGYASDMQATKAVFLAEFCAQRNQSYLRFDYSGNGVSEGVFAKGTIGQWVKDTLALIDQVTQQNFILVGSSMGGWIGLLAALARPERIKGFIGIASAPDFTEEIWLHHMSPDQRADCQRTGSFTIREASDFPLVLSDALLQEGRKHLLLKKTIPLNIPVTLLQGKQDQEVPWETAFKIKDKIAPSEAKVLIIEDGEHRLARPEDLKILGNTVAEMSAQIAS